MDHPASFASVRELAAQVAQLTPTSDADVAGVGFMAGAIYALGRAIEFGYDDSRSHPDPKSMTREFRETLNAVAAGQTPPRAWLAGFFFHAATMRLAALNERLDRSADVAPKVRKSVNSLKHEADSHISGRRTVTFDQALKAAQDLCDVLEKQIP